MIKNIYFERYAYPERFFNEPPHPDTNLIVVIPSFKEPALLESLESLLSCDRTAGKVEVIVVVNHAENASEADKTINITSYQDLKVFAEHVKSDFITLKTIKAFDLPVKEAGVGLARKIGMDEAAYRFEQLNKDGVIVCFDADSAVQPNYLQAIEQHFEEHPKSPGCSIHYEHPLTDDAIIPYELHLRYYIQALCYADYPFAFHTIGSSMAVRSKAYQKQNGMNKRKAGEDFYFIHKIIPLGHYTNLTKTTVIPSPRISDRVPFGTGRAMQEYQKGKDLYQSYNFQIFEHLKTFMGTLPEIYQKRAFPDSLEIETVQFLNDVNFKQELEKLLKQSTDLASFKTRFYQWFNGFKVLKYVHFLRDHYYPNTYLVDGVNTLLQKHFNQEAKADGKSQLLLLRELEKNYNN